MQKTAIYGLPMNPRPLLNQLQGASFCVSYGTRDKLGKQLDQAIELVGQDQILLVDNGAFSLWMAARKAAKKNGAKPVETMTDAYIEDFGVWANEILERCPQAIAVLPDKIDGTAEENAQLIRETMTMFPDLRMMPMWHLHEPIEQLLWLCEGAGCCWEYVGIGSSGEYKDPGSPAWEARMAEVMAAVDAWEAESEGAYVRPRFHLMRAQSHHHRFAFDSSDSVNVAINHGRYRAEGEGHVGRFAKRINDRIQASAGPEADHQAKRPLLGHIENAAWEARIRAIGDVRQEPPVEVVGYEPELSWAEADYLEERLAA